MGLSVQLENRPLSASVTRDKRVKVAKSEQQNRKSETVVTGSNALAATREELSHRDGEQSRVGKTSQVQGFVQSSVRCHVVRFMDSGLRAGCTQEQQILDCLRNDGISVQTARLLFVTVLKPRTASPSTPTPTPRETNPKHATKSECASVCRKRWLTSMATRRLLNLRAAPEKSTYAGPSIILVFRSGGGIIHLFFGLERHLNGYLTQA